MSCNRPAILAVSIVLIPEVRMTRLAVALLLPNIPPKVRTFTDKKP